VINEHVGRYLIFVSSYNLESLCQLVLPKFCQKETHKILRTQVPYTQIGGGDLGAKPPPYSILQLTLLGLQTSSSQIFN